MLFPSQAAEPNDLYGWQLEVMSKTSILITPCGGTGTVLTFLQPGATAIVMNYWHDFKGISVQMEAIYYWNLEYLDLQVRASPHA